MTTTTDTIRAVATYAIAFSIVIGGFTILYLTRAEVTSSELRLVIAGFMGSAVTFVFSQETGKQATKAQTAASVSGATLHANGLTNTPPPP